MYARNKVQEEEGRMPSVFCGDTKNFLKNNLYSTIRVPKAFSIECPTDIDL